MAAHTVHTGGHSARSAGRVRTDAFRTAPAELGLPADDRVVAIVRAAAVRWRRPRSPVAEALPVRGYDVQHTTGPGKLTPATPRDVAVVDGDRITYPGGAPCST